MTNFIFKCPVTGLNVQHSDEAAEQSVFLAISCKACGGTHVVRREVDNATSGLAETDCVDGDN